MKKTKGPWLYAISKHSDSVFRVRGKEYPADNDTYRQLLMSGRLKEDDRWGPITTFWKDVEPKDDVFIYTGDEDRGIIGFATVNGKDERNKELLLDFDEPKSKALWHHSEHPERNGLRAPEIRRWLNYTLRPNLRNLAPVADKVYRRLPWEKKRQSHVASSPRDRADSDTRVKIDRGIRN